MNLNIFFGNGAFYIVNFAIKVKTLFGLGKSLFFKCRSPVIESALAKLQEMEKQVLLHNRKDVVWVGIFLQFCERTFNDGTTTLEK